ncbi:MAG: hypothetical protein ACSLE1_16395 [Sphingobium sp.]
MTDTSNSSTGNSSTGSPSTDTGYTDPVDPDFANSEQDETGEQAQDVADDARLRSTDLTQETERGGSSNRAQILPDDVPDLVETMNAMVNSGRIDNGAFAGEPMMDDEEDILGDTDSDDEEDDVREQ